MDGSPPPPPSNPAPDTPVEPPLDVVEPLCAVFRKALKTAGLKYTPERAQVLDTIIQFDAPFHIDRVVASVREAGFRVSKATVYRTIRLLADAGIVQRLPLGDDDAAYHLVYGRKPADLIIRTDTRTVVPIDVPELSRLVERACSARGLSAKGHRLYVFAEAAP